MTTVSRPGDAPAAADAPVAAGAPDAFDAAVAAMAARREADAARRGFWLAHHWADQHERCSVIGGRRVCRRCLTLYPLAITVAVASLAGLTPWPERLDPWAIYAICLPGTVEFVAEQLGRLRYSARRQVAVTVLVAIGLGRGMAYEWQHRWSAEFWGPLFVYGTMWFLAAVTARRLARSR
jgi:hypothetical protein